MNVITLPKDLTDTWAAFTRTLRLVEADIKACPPDTIPSDLLITYAFRMHILMALMVKTPEKFEELCRALAGHITDPRSRGVYEMVYEDNAYQPEGEPCQPTA